VVGLGAAGRKPDAMGSLEDLAERLGIK